MNKDQLKESLTILKGKKITMESVATNLSLTPQYLSRMTNGAQPISKSFISAFHSKYSTLLPVELFSDEIIVKTNAGTIIEKQIQHEAWLNVLEGMVVSLVQEKSGKSLVSIISQLKKEKAMEADRISDELRRKKK